VGLGEGGREVDRGAALAMGLIAELLSSLVPAVLGAMVQYK